MLKLVAKVESIRRRCFNIERLLTLNALLLIAAALWLRADALNNIPGFNGDEAWYGVQAWTLAHGGAVSWHTPTGNPLSPLFVGPLALLHLGLLPSVSLPRLVALAGGLLALLLNWTLCRWVYDRRTAAVSTAILAVLPVNIAYSRFAWDASQSLAATLPALYCTLAAIRFPDRFGRQMAFALLALAVAFWVHPTNVFLGTFPIVASMAWYRSQAGRQRAAVGRSSLTTLLLLILAATLFLAWFSAVHWSRGPAPARFAERLGGCLLDFPAIIILIPRLFLGGTIYRYLAGSRSWLEWPLAADHEGWGLDVALFWAIALYAVWLLCQSAKNAQNPPNHHPRADNVLLAAWAFLLLAFALVAGAPAILPGYERFAIVLIAPTVLLIARGASLLWERNSLFGRVALGIAALCGWLLLADFHTHYFRFIERTGGQSHLAFRTAAVEPKQAALNILLDPANARTGVSPQKPLWIVCSEWWNRWPLRYLSSPHADLYVPEPEMLEDSPHYRQALAEGRVAFVEFHGSPADRRIDTQLAGRPVIRRTLFDYGGHPLLSVIYVERP